MTEDKKPDLAKTYKLKGAQQISLSEYEAMRARDAKKFKVRVPPALKFILQTPLFVLFICGIFFIPYVLYLIATSTSTPSEPEKKDIAYDDLRKKDQAANP